jgi:hypothetical protein
MRNLQGFVVKLQRLISGNVIVHTDEYTIYEGIVEKIPEVLEHRVVNHGSGEWAHGDVHVNGCENRNGFLGGYLRRYRGVSKRYLQGYLDFLVFLLNEKKNNGLKLFSPTTHRYEQARYKLPPHKFYATSFISAYSFSSICRRVVCLDMDMNKVSVTVLFIASGARGRKPFA